MIPRALSDWSIEIITGLLSSGIHESEEFDFKVALPHSKDETGKARLRETCCAFANSIGGGFLVFGVHDDRTRTATDRLTGMDASEDFPARFGDFPRLCSPSVHWVFRNPPLRLPTDAVIHVVYIPPSWKAPHAYGDVDQGWRFTKRTNKGTEGMSIEEVRGMFLSFYEKRLRLQLLDTELALIESNASTAIIAEPDKIESTFSLVTLGTHMIESLVIDTYPLTAASPPLISTLNQLRKMINVANNKATVFFGTATLSFTNQAERNREHNEFMARACEEIVKRAQEARAYLKPILQP